MSYINLHHLSICVSTRGCGLNTLESVSYCTYACNCFVYYSYYAPLHCFRRQAACLHSILPFSVRDHTMCRCRHIDYTIDTLSGRRADIMAHSSLQIISTHIY